MNIKRPAAKTDYVYSFARPSQDFVDSERSKRKEERSKKTAEKKQEAERVRLERVRNQFEFRANARFLHPHGMASVLSGPNIDAADNGLWADRSELQEVLSGLFISNFFGATDIQKLRRHGITHIVVCANELSTDHAPQFSYLKLTGLTDSTHTQLMPYLRQALPWIDRALSAQGRVLVHCGAGMSRSGAIVTSYLMWSQNLSMKEALTKAKVCRPIAEPNSGFLKQLEEFQRTKIQILKHTA